MQNQLNQARVSCMELLNVAAELDFLAVAFGQTGNFHMEERLHSYAIAIEENANNMQDAVSGMLNEAFNASQEATHNMVAAALASLKGPIQE